MTNPNTDAQAPALTDPAPTNLYFLHPDSQTATARYARPHLSSYSDQVVTELLTAVIAERTEVADEISREVRFIERELERRIRERLATNPKARSIPSRTHKIELVDKFLPYVFDPEGLKKAQAQLRDEEAAKLGKWVGDRVTPCEACNGTGKIETPAHFEPGSVNSIVAITSRYAGTDVGDVLKEATTRTPLGSELVVKELGK